MPSKFPLFLRVEPLELSKLMLREGNDLPKYTQLRNGRAWVGAMVGPGSQSRTHRTLIPSLCFLLPLSSRISVGRCIKNMRRGRRKKMPKVQRKEENEGSSEDIALG